MTQDDILFARSALAGCRGFSSSYLVCTGISRLAARRGAHTDFTQRSSSRSLIFSRSLFFLAAYLHFSFDFLLYMYVYTLFFSFPPFSRSFIQRCDLAWRIKIQQFVSYSRRTRGGGDNQTGLKETCHPLAIYIPFRDTYNTREKRRVFQQQQQQKKSDKCFRTKIHTSPAR